MLKRRKNSYYLLFIIGCILFISGCNKESDAIKFKNEYESYNQTLRSVSINEDNPFIYSSIDEYNLNIENKSTFSVLFCSSKNEWCRMIINPLIQASINTGLYKIYYIDTDFISNSNLAYDFGKPVVLGVVKGEVVTMTSGIDNIDSSNEELTNDKYNEIIGLFESIFKRISKELNTCNIDSRC